MKPRSSRSSMLNRLRKPPTDHPADGVYKPFQEHHPDERSSTQILEYPVIRDSNSHLPSANTEISCPESIIHKDEVASSPSRHSSFSQEDSLLQTRLKMLEVSQRKMNNDSQKEMKDSHKEMSYELSKTATESQTQTQQAMVQNLAQGMAQTRQLIESC